MKEWKFEQEFPQVPACVHQTVLETLENLGEKRKMKHIKKTKWLILAAALTATFGLTVAASELFDWNPKAAKTFGEPVKDVQNTLTMEGVAKEQKISVTDNGITVTAIQTMNDENIFYALLLVTAENEIIDGSGYFGNPSPQLITINPDAFCNVSMGFLDMPIAEPSTQGYYEVYALKNIGEEWQEESITISLENYSYDVYNKSKDDVTDFTDCTSELVTGKWELTLPLGAMQTDNTIKITEPIQVVMQGVSVTIEELILTPLAIKITYSLADVEKLQQEIYSSEEDVYLQELFLSGFINKNEEVTECGFTASSGRHTPDGKDILLMGLGQAVDVHEIQAILLGNEKVRVDLE